MWEKALGAMGGEFIGKLSGMAPYHRFRGGKMNISGHFIGPIVRNGWGGATSAEGGGNLGWGHGSRKADMERKKRSDYSRLGNS